MNPDSDPGGPKTCGSGGSRSGSGTLQASISISDSSSPSPACEHKLPVPSFLFTITCSSPLRMPNELEIIYPCWSSLSLPRSSHPSPTVSPVTSYDKYILNIRKCMITVARIRRFFWGGNITNWKIKSLSEGRTNWHFSLFLMSGAIYQTSGLL